MMRLGWFLAIGLFILAGTACVKQETAVPPPPPAPIAPAAAITPPAPPVAPPPPPANIVRAAGPAPAIVAVAPSTQTRTVRIDPTADVWISDVGEEKAFSVGKAERLKLKSIQEMSIIRFPGDTLRGTTIVGGRLVLHRVEGDQFLRYIGVSTVSSRWEEGSSDHYQVDTAGRGATFTEASTGTRPWAWPGSHFTDVRGSNCGTLVSVQPLSDLGDGWFAVAVDLPLLEALAAGATDGFNIFDACGQTLADNFVNSRESQFPPRLEVTVADQPAPAPCLVAIEEKPPSRQFCGEGVVEVLVTWQDVFTFDISVNGAPVERWRIAAPFKPVAGAEYPRTGTTAVLLRDLPADTEVTINITGVNRSGVASAPLAIKLRTSPLLPVPALADTAVNTRPGATAGPLAAWAVPECTAVDPVTGAVLFEKDAAGYRESSFMWSGADKTVTLSGGRGEILAFGLCLEPASGSASGVKLRLDPIPGLEQAQVRMFRTWYLHKSGGKDLEAWTPEYAVPLTAGDNFAIPWVENAVTGQKNQCVVVDIAVPSAAKPGTYRGTLTYAADNIPEQKLAVAVEVFPFIIPAVLSFTPDMNCYGGPGRAGDARFNESHRIAHYNRCVLNRVPYSQLGRIHDDAIPAVAGEGKELRVTDWSAFDRNWGPLLNGSLFADLPRAGVPVRNLYLPMCEFWPASHDKYYAWDGLGDNSEASYVRHMMEAPLADETFAQTYRDGIVKMTGEFVRHYREKGYDRTAVQFYLNNKWDTGSKGRETSSNSTWYTLDEPYNWVDWHALVFYSKLFHQGLKEAAVDAAGLHFVFRGDISRPHWQGDMLYGLMENMYANTGSIGRQRRMDIMIHEQPTNLYIYGSATPPGVNLFQNAAVCLNAWFVGANGFCPYQSVGNDEAFTEGERKGHGNALFVPGNRFGLPAVGSLRLWAFRRGAQDCEYLRLWALSAGLTREQIQRAAGSLVGATGELHQAREDGASAVTVADPSALKLYRVRRGVAAILAAKPAAEWDRIDAASKIVEPSALNTGADLTLKPVPVRGSFGLTPGEKFQVVFDGPTAMIGRGDAFNNRMIGNEDGTTRSFLLMREDLPRIAGQPIFKATLTFYVRDPHAKARSKVGFFAMLTDWNASATLAAAGAGAWKGAAFQEGVDCAAMPGGTTVVENAADPDVFDPPVQYTADVTELVRAWASGKLPNKGLVMYHLPDQGVDDSYGARFEMHRPGGRSEYQPVLEITPGVPAK